MTALANELELGGEEVGQNPRWLHGLSHWLGDFIMFNNLVYWPIYCSGQYTDQRKIEKRTGYGWGKRRNGNQKFCFRFTEIF